MSTPDGPPGADVIAHTEIRDVRLVQVNAEVSQIPIEMAVEFKTGAVGVHQNEDEIVARFEHTAQFATPEGQPVATINLAHAARFSYDTELRLNDDAVAEWVFGNVYFMVYPYVRESLQDTCLRLGLPPVVLGYLKRGELAPESISMVVTATSFQQKSTPDEPLPLDEQLVDERA